MFLLQLGCAYYDTRAGDDLDGAVDSADPEVYDCASGTAVQLGTGELGFEDLDDGDFVTLVHGAQGGWHVFYSFLAWNYGELLQYEFTAWDEELGVYVDAIDTPINQALLEGEAECSHVAWGAQGVLAVTDDPETKAIETPPEVLAGHTLTLCLRAADLVSGAEDEDCVSVIAACDPVDVGVYPSCEASVR